MGAHYAPPFAILTMHRIESEALRILEEKHGICPRLYKRYIDDVIMGPFQKKYPHFDLIVSTFNSINENVQFTIDVPEDDQPLNFLDISITIVEDNVEFKWYSKNSHSNITLRKDSWLPQSVKSNFISNSIKQVKEKCSSTEEGTIAFQKLKDKLIRNGYKNKDISGHNKSRRNTTSASVSDHVFLQMDFINDRCARKINKIMKKSDFPIKLTNIPANNLVGLFKENRKKKHSNCEICDRLPDNYTCDDRFLVYKFTCSHCNEFYIGMSNRPFNRRYNEHRRSLEYRDCKSALSVHAVRHNDCTLMKVTDFMLDILSKNSSPLMTRLAEADFIGRLRPMINRKEELLTW